jgi:hypothetical protein
LEVEVIKGNNRPYQAKDEYGNWLTYFRHHDQNLVANKVLRQVWRKEEKGSGVLVKFGKAENSLMDYLAKNGSITLSKFRKIAKISNIYYFKWGVAPYPFRSFFVRPRSLVHLASPSSSSHIRGIPRFFCLPKRNEQNNLASKK